MDRDDLTRAQDAISRFILACENIVVFTGAGISTEVGVPDFRSPGSPWRIHTPIPFQDFMADDKARREAWRRKFTMDDVYRDVKPGATHRFIAEGVAQGRVRRVVTQNIDNLHQRSGVPDDKIIELHGNGSYARCMACEQRHEIADIRAHFEREGEPPPCGACGGIVKSATVSFGQQMPLEAVRQAALDMKAADGIIILGSSLVVRPAADLPVMAAEAGAQVLIVNAEKTPLDRIAACVVRGDLPSVLPNNWPLTDRNISPLRH